MTDTCHTPLGVHQVIGLSFTVEAGCLSFTAVVIAAGLVTRNAIAERKQPFRTHADIYIGSLLLADSFQAVGAILDARWVSSQAIWCGTYCNAQGAVQELGETGVAMSTLAITIYTFCCLFLRWSPSRSRVLPIFWVCIIWTYSFLFFIIGYATRPKPKNGELPFIDATPYWCWIRDSYALRIPGEYLWIWITVITSAILYTLVYLKLNGFIFKSDGSWHIITISRRKPSHHGTPPADQNAPTPNIRLESHVRNLSELGERAASESKKMILYPCAYAITVLPQTIARWAVKVNLEIPVQDRPFAVVGAAVSIFGLSGFINVILFLSTRPSLFRLDDGRRRRSQSAVGSCSRCAPLRTVGGAVNPSAELTARPTRIVLRESSSSSASSGK
ncbi:hypothetical protein BOTBODRAFT_338488 [Botryobasidium botryosum FD-172 SS1]|uniref:Glucose receptor Git3 N-terminal domain-containing protein n=1 Tax=Botryobasidium botryosum (strain FD-172 SS1) TaxID=930990 RepID=A0A067MS48_BOTB1|nr:hypothetical protein BOTBODRAFT_338488 [Botryobasidium botryosum FD-172 SS1]